MATQFCTNCGSQFEGGFCTNCGARAATNFTPPGAGRQVKSIRTGIEPIDRFLAGKSMRQLVAMAAILLNILLMLILMLVDYFAWRGPSHITKSAARYIMYSNANFYIWLPFMLIHIGTSAYAFWLAYRGNFTTAFMILLAQIAVFIIFWITDGIILAIVTNNFVAGANGFLASLWMGCSVYVHACLWSVIFQLIALVALKK